MSDNLVTSEAINGKKQGIPHRTKRKHNTNNREGKRANNPKIEYNEQEDKPTVEKQDLVIQQEAIQQEVIQQEAIENHFDEEEWLNTMRQGYINGVEECGRDDFGILRGLYAWFIDGEKLFALGVKNRYLRLERERKSYERRKCERERMNYIHTLEKIKHLPIDIIKYVIVPYIMSAYYLETEYDTCNAYICNCRDHIDS